MSFTPKTWTTGNRVTSTDLNRIENGIANAGSAMIANASNSNGAGNPLIYGSILDKTFTEIYTALSNGIPVYIKVTIGTGVSDYATERFLGHVVSAVKYADIYRVHVLGYIGAGMGDFHAGTAMINFEASSASGYPVAKMCIGTTSSALADLWD